jgi:hypothetical protein
VKSGSGRDGASLNGLFRFATLLLMLAFTPACADIWGLKDLTGGSDGGAGSDGSVGPDGGPDGTSPGTSACGPLDTITNCGACGVACDVTQSGGVACQNGVCTYGFCEDGWQNCDKAGADTNGCESSKTSTLSCGACGNVCDTLHSAGATCVLTPDGTAACRYDHCLMGWADCDSSGTDTDGCETSLTTAANCGACHLACDTVNSQGASCDDGKTCIYTGCNSGQADCHTTAPDTDGCETTVPANTCTACGGMCDTAHSDGASCDTTGTATCKYTGCESNYVDCNTTPPDTDGCDTQITTAANCGQCGRACDTKTSIGAGCTGGTCTYTGCVSGYADCDVATAPDTNGCESSLSSTASCGQCGRACSTKTGPASCNGTTCSYQCNAGLIDCNAGTAPDTDGCECATPGCCSGGVCQTTHSNGVGQSFFDCNKLGTYNQTQAQAACEAFAGAGQCKKGTACCGGLSALGACLGTTDSSECGTSGGNCRCWQYSGTSEGTVQTTCSASCGASGDPGWN